MNNFTDKPHIYYELNSNGKFKLQIIYMLEYHHTLAVITTRFHMKQNNKEDIAIFIL